jgi:prepilin-type N-terminal cleavage/methylation domain-containing protein
MAKNNTNLKEKGFTIIEVLIVLAIAGLILLIVFLAVPALQRNSRNTQIRNSAAAMLGGINDFVSNNNGLQPANGGCVLTGNTVAITGAAGTTPAEAKVQGGYTVNCNTAATMPTTTGNIQIRLNAKCNGNTFDTASTPRAYSAGFMIEANGGAPVAQCVES